MKLTSLLIEHYWGLYPKMFAGSGLGSGLCSIQSLSEHLTVIGKPHRKPQHFEVLGRNARGELIELHVELDGKLRRSMPVRMDDDKWAQELSAA